MKQLLVLFLLVGITAMAVRSLTLDPKTSHLLYSRAQQAEMAGHVKKAVNWYRKAAQRGNIQAQYAYGYFLWQERDYANAYTWLSQAAEQEQAEAQNLLATMYQNGHGVHADFHEAVAWYRLAACNGNDFAKRNLLLMQNQGLL